MKSQNRWTVYMIIPLMLMATASWLVAGDEKSVTQKAYSAADLKAGGLLYDNWVTIKKARTNGNHPLYPTDAKKNGPSTWRCKECHGWDYIGAAGRYREGSHFTGISGLYHARNKPPQILYAALHGASDGHDFSAHLSRRDAWNLVKFIREGQRDIHTAIDGQGRAKSTPTTGELLYASNCSACHGADGNRIDFKPKKAGLQGIGWLANKNPQESLHKIRWGQPGTEMPSMVADKGLREADIIAILAYSQSLQ